MWQFYFAIQNGGITTFLAFILLANSVSHVFHTFFKIFVLVVLFGLFQGLVLLPVILSEVGPTSNVVTPEKRPSVQEESRVSVVELQHVSKTDWNMKVEFKKHYLTTIGQGEYCQQYLKKVSVNDLLGWDSPSSSIFSLLAELLIQKC